VWLALGRAGDAVGIIDVLLFSYARLGYLDLHYVCVCMCVRVCSSLRYVAKRLLRMAHGAWRMACCGAHHGVADGPPFSAYPVCPSASLGAVHP
jgi:hypothetical protein